MQAGFAAGLDPEAFWGLSPGEFLLVCEARLGPAPAPPFGRAELSVLMARFPD